MGIDTCHFRSVLALNLASATSYSTVRRCTVLYLDGLNKALSYRMDTSCADSIARWDSLGAVLMT